jgi:hypothetical protein
MLLKRRRGSQESVCQWVADSRHFKEVLRRENQGLKVYPIDRSSVFSMTGTYF